MAIYESFNNFILRTPAFSVEKWEKYTEDIEQGNFQALLNDDYFLEAIFIATPILYEEALRFKAGGLSMKEEKSLISSLLRYFTRMSWRCTPFGLFSGCTIGNITNDNTIILPTIDHYNRYIRMDMNCLCALIQEIEKQDEIRYVIKYYPNNSIYVVGNYLRYVEYHYFKTHRKHEIVSVEKNKYLQTILHYAKDGKTIPQLAEQRVEEGITIEDGIEFVIELIENQLLISELSPTVTGIDLLERTITQLQNIAIEHPIHQKTLIDIQLLLFQINQHSIGKTEILYKKIIDIFKENQIDYDPQYLFQIDLIKQSISVEITQEITQDIIDVIVFLNRLTQKNQNPSLLEFS